jgi:spore coat protein Y
MSKCHTTCICDAVAAVKAEQDAVSGCPTSCFNDLLSPISDKDTIPFMLYCKDGCQPFKAFGNIGGIQGTGNRAQCFSTFFFRVENVKDDCCATLSLLRPLNTGLQPINNNLMDPCDSQLHALEKTDVCIEVDLKCFCIIECLSPELIGRERGCTNSNHASNEEND